MPPADFLPESRSREKRGVVRSAEHGNLIPIFCANCGKPWGFVPEHYVTFAFALCNPCAETHGDVAHMYKEPDSIFWERVQNTEREEDLSKISREWDEHVRRF